MVTGKRAEVKALKIAIARPHPERGYAEDCVWSNFRHNGAAQKSWHCMYCCRPPAIAFPEDTKVRRRMTA